MSDEEQVKSKREKSLTD